MSCMKKTKQKSNVCVDKQCSSFRPLLFVLTTFMLCIIIYAAKELKSFDENISLL